MKTKLITLLIAIVALLGSANAQKYDRKIQFHKNGELITTYDITDVDSITFLKVDYLEASYSVSPVGTGSVTIDGSNETPQYVLPGTNVTYNAIANSGYKFKSWNMGGTELSTSPTLTLPIYSNTMLTAEFQVLPTYSVMVVSSGGGTVSSSATSVLEGNNVTLTATPNNGYKFKNWTLDGNIVSTNNPYTATVLSNSIYIANFEKKSYAVSVSSTTGGTATTSSNSVVYEGNVTLTATPNEGYKFVNWTVNGEVVSTENPYIATIIANRDFVANFKEDPYNGHEYVDLGLPSGLKWATCNVGADTPEEYGDYFAWGETEPKTTYNWSTYKYCNGSEETMTKYCVSSSFGTVDNKTVLELEDDAAHVNWGGNWRMPTKAERDELRNTSNCTWTRTTQNGVEGYKVTSKVNGNSIFLPAAGYRIDDGIYGSGYSAECWSSSLVTNPTNAAFSLYLQWGVERDAQFREYGLSVRPVCE